MRGLKNYLVIYEILDEPPKTNRLEKKRLKKAMSNIVLYLVFFQEGT